MLGTNNELHHFCWLSADTVRDRAFNPISAMTTMPKLTIEASKSPAAPARPQSGVCYVAVTRALPRRSISSTPEPAAKSP